MMDLQALEESRDIIALGELADSIRKGLHGSSVTFVRVCDFDGSTPVPGSAGEARIFKTPSTLDEAVAVVGRAKDAAGAVPLSAFCLFELSKLSEGLPAVLKALQRSGLEQIAQAPIDKLVQPERALLAATDAGLRVARLTVDETPTRPWSEVCRDVEALQHRVQSLRAFAPLARRIDQSQPTTGYADVRRIALARVLVPNIETIQVDWGLYGPKLAQVALTFGADDIDSVSAADDESAGHRRSPVEEIRRSIQAASLTPVERDGAFKVR